MTLKFENKRIEILRAAQKRFTRHGLAKTTIEEIARDMRISKSSIYHYFLSKEEIFYRCVEMEMADYFGEIAGILNNEHDEALIKLDKLLTLKCTMHKDFRLLYQLLITIITEQSNSLEDDLLIKFMNEETTIFNSSMNILLPGISDTDIEKINKTYPLASAALPLISGLQETINQKVDHFSNAGSATEMLKEHWKKQLLALVPGKS